MSTQRRVRTIQGRCGTCNRVTNRLPCPHCEADRVLALFSEDRQQLVEDATVTVLCAPEDQDRLRPWIDQQRAAWPVPVRLRTSPFLRPGTALYWQKDGVHAPSTPRTLAVHAPCHGRA